MCLTCSRKHPVITGKENIKNVFYFKGDQKLPFRSTVHTHDNKWIELTITQVNEIIDNALGIIVTGIDLKIDIWAIQWPNGYDVVSL